MSDLTLGSIQASFSPGALRCQLAFPLILPCT